MSRWKSDVEFYNGSIRRTSVDPIVLTPDTSGICAWYSFEEKGVPHQDFLLLLNFSSGEASRYALS